MNRLKKIKQEIKALKLERELLRNQTVKLEVGQWYKLNECLFNYQESSSVYGFFKGEWVDYQWTWDDMSATKATVKEVDEALIAEARKRGFYEGMKERFVCLMDGLEWDCKNEFNNCQDSSLGLGANYIFKKGTWTEIIK